jgi:hypothetical protein
MKAIFVLSLVLVGVAAVLGYTRPDVMSVFISHTSSRSEPAALLLSGGALLGIAGAVRRFVSDTPRSRQTRNTGPLPQPRTAVLPCRDIQ